MVKVLRSIVRGPLEPHVVGFAEGLLRQGYSRSAAEQHVCFIAHLDRWMQAEGVGLDGLSGSVIERYLAQRRAAGYVEYRSMKALRPLLGYLAPLGVLPIPQEVPPGPVEELLGRYRAWLLVERGVTPGTARGYVDCVRPFVAGRLRDGVLDLAGVTAADVTGFVLAVCPGRAVGSAKLIVCALRSLLRWLHLTGAVPVSLAAAAPSVAGWRLSGLPKGLEPGQLRSLLASCDRRTPTGRRDYAIMLLLARLGLRAGEVARLGLDDIDWRRGEIAVRRQGPAGRTTAAARRGGRGDRGVSAPRPTRHRAGAQRVRPRPRPASGVDDRRGDDGRVRRRAARRVWAGCTRTGCGTPPPPRCCKRAARWPRSGRCCGTARRCQQRSTPRSTGTRSRCWPAPGRSQSLGGAS